MRLAAEVIAFLGEYGPEGLRPPGVAKLQGPGGIHGPAFDSGLIELLAEDELRPGTAVHIAAADE